jgi:predicted dehydrogenase
VASVGGGAEPLRAGVVGTGALGYHHARILASSPGVELIGVFDRRPEVAAKAAADHGTRAFASLDELAGEIDAAVVAVPTVDHAEVGCRLLARGLHVLVEKPMASSLAEADRLLAAAARAPGATGPPVLAVGHVEFYNPAVQALLALGRPPRFIEIERLSVFTPRSLDVDVILDLMIHDLQILHALDPTPIAEVRSTGIDVLSPRVDIASARLAFASGCVANLTASRVSSERVRKLRVFQARSYYSLDYQQQEIKGYRLNERDGGREIVPDDLPVTRVEPLRAELAAFAAACRGERVALVDGTKGRQALATALAVAEAIRT